jgi:putative aldouronate transport system permease protein
MNYIKTSKYDKLLDFAIYAFLLFAAIVTFYPFWYEICVSFSSYEQAVIGGIFILPREFTFRAYIDVISTKSIWIAFKNSALTTITGTILSVFITALTAYPLSKRRIPGNKFMVGLVLFTMLFGGGMIPLYIVVNKLGLINSLWSLVLPTLISSYNVFIIKNFFEAIPEEIEESAFIDGANPIQVFLKLILPLSMPVIATVSLWVAVGTWNNFYNALIFLNKRDKYTLPLLIRDIIQGQQQARETGEIGKSALESVIAATIVISIIPIVCFYPFLQKHFVKGVMIGSVKG